MCLFRGFKFESGLLNGLLTNRIHTNVLPQHIVDFNKIINFNLCKHRYISSESNKTDSTDLTSTYFRTPASEKVFSDITVMDSLAPREFRIFLNDVVESKVDDVLLWSKAASYCIKNASDFKFFDALYVLESFNKAKIYDKSVFSEFSKVLIIQSAQMEPRHLNMCINVYAPTGTFPEGLFLEVFYGIIKQSEKMYSNEFVDIFLTLSKWNIKNKQVLSVLCKSLSKNVSILRYTELTQIVGACRSLEIDDEPFYFIMDSWQEKELAMMSLHEMLESLKKLRDIEVKWPYYEELLFKEFVKKTKELDGEGVNQLVDPFDCLEFLKLTRSLSKEYLLSLTKWCSEAVYNPPTRSQKRPLSHQLVELYNLVQEYGVEEKYIDKAVLKFVTSKGGLRMGNPKPIPTLYKPNRKYIYTEDPENPRVVQEIKFLDQDQIPGDKIEKQEKGEKEDKTQHIDKIIDELEPYPKFFDNIKIKKPSTQSCGKVSFRLKNKTYRHKNLHVNS